MVDLIERQAVMLRVREFIENPTYNENMLMNDLNTLPSAEPEQKTGHWIDEGFYADGHGAHAFRCSECGEHIIEYDVDPFCRWCGADMTKDDIDWLVNLVDERKKFVEACRMCSECDIFDKCQEEHRDYCEKEKIGNETN